MTEDTMLIKDKQDDLKCQLKKGQDKLLIDIVFHRIDHFVKKIPGTPDTIPLWLSVVIIAIITSLGGYFFAIFLNDTFISRIEVLPDINPPIYALMYVVGALFMMAAKMLIDIIFNTIRESTVNAIYRTSDLDDLQDWLKTNLSLKRQLIIILLVAFVVIGIWTFLFFRTQNSPKISDSIPFLVVPMFLGLILGFQGSTLIYSVYMVIGLLHRFTQYHFRLYAANPSNTEVVGRLTDAMNNIIFTITLFAFMPFYILFRNETTYIFLIKNISAFLLVSWLPPITIFLISQILLHRIIVKAKWEKLNQIEMDIKNFEIGANFQKKDDIDIVNRFMDYHDRIKRTRNTSLDFRTGLNFLNSLLLPVIALLLANIKDILEFVQNLRLG